jgi:competence protein ComEA
MTLYRPVLPLAAVVLFLAAVPSHAQLPEGPGREQVMKVCIGCHEVERSVSLRQDRNGWQTTLAKMVGLGMKSTDEELVQILDYLVEHFPAGEVPPVNINKANAIQLEARLSLLRSQAAKIIAYRRKNGVFASLEDLKKIPDLDFEKIESKKDRIVF